MDRWENKVAVVTGASSEIGLNIARHLIHSGLNVVGLARRRERLDELARNLEGQNGKFYSVKCDITNEEDILNAFKWITENVGIVHILVNNAGIRPHGNLIDGDTENWKMSLDTNSIGLCYAEREAVKIMRANHVDGHIIHMNSTFGNYINDFVGLDLYPASKSEVTALTETLRQELDSFDSQIKVTTISPGFVRSQMVINGLLPDDISQAVLYVLGTPPHVQVHDIIIRPLGE